jgi:hypothetical protein
LNINEGLVKLTKRGNIMRKIIGTEEENKDDNNEWRD